MLATPTPATGFGKPELVLELSETTLPNRYPHHLFCLRLQSVLSWFPLFILTLVQFFFARHRSRILGRFFHLQHLPQHYRLLSQASSHGSLHSLPPTSVLFSKCFVEDRSMPQIRSNRGCPKNRRPPFPNRVVLNHNPSRAQWQAKAEAVSLHREFLRNCPSAFVRSVPS